MTLLHLIPAAAAVVVAAPLAHAQEASSKAFVNFVEVEGQLEFSVSSVRVLQVAGAAERGQTADEVRQPQRIARRALEAYELKEYVAAPDEYLFLVPCSARRAWPTTSWGPARSSTSNRTGPSIRSPGRRQFNQQGTTSPTAWPPARRDLETGDPAIIVAICDTGILLSHADLQLHRRRATMRPAIRGRARAGRSRTSTVTGPSAWGPRRPTATTGSVSPGLAGTSDTAPCA